jgi:hypothetical protein
MRWRLIGSPDVPRPEPAAPLLLGSQTLQFAFSGQIRPHDLSHVLTWLGKDRVNPHQSPASLVGGMASSLLRFSNAHSAFAQTLAWFFDPFGLPVRFPSSWGGLTPFGGTNPTGDPPRLLHPQNH